MPKLTKTQQAYKLINELLDLLAELPFTDRSHLMTILIREFEKRFK